MSKQKIKVVELQFDRGERKFDENGNYIGERQTITFNYGDTRWEPNVRNLRYMGATHVEVIGAYGHTTKDEKQAHPDDVYQNESVEVTQELRDEVAKLFSNVVVIGKSKEQEQIDELKATIEEMKKSGGKKSEPAKEPDANVEELDGLHADFKKKFDKNVPNNKKNDLEWIKNELAK